MKPRKVFQTKNRGLPSVIVNGRTNQNPQEWVSCLNPSKLLYQKSSDCLTQMKYYINCGMEKTVLNASTPQQAAVLGFRKIIIESEEEEFEMPLEIRVSQRGPEEHEDDFVISTFVVIGLLYLMREDEDEEDGE